MMTPDALVRSNSATRVDREQVREVTPQRWGYYAQVSVSAPAPALALGGSSLLTDYSPAPPGAEVGGTSTTAPLTVRTHPRADRGWGPWSLTQRELEVLQLLAEGATNSDIAARLFISPKTTKNHLAAIFHKLDVTNRTHALVRAVVMGLVSIE
jgi:DNA-binding CsgD family transcriptional regulator